MSRPWQRRREVYSDWVRVDLRCQGCVEDCGRGFLVYVLLLSVSALCLLFTLSLHFIAECRLTSGAVKWGGYEACASSNMVRARISWQLVLAVVWCYPRCRVKVEGLICRDWYVRRLEPEI